jgi:hypothetical protein
MCTVIDDKDVTPVNLSLALEQAVIRHDLNNDKELYVTEAGWFPFWIRVCRGTGKVGLSTHTLFRINTGNLQRLEFANEVNSKFNLVSAHVDAMRLRVDHCLLFRDGMTRESFIRACRMFNDSLNRAMSELDPDRSILMAPGESEENDEDQDETQGPQ